MNEKLDTNKPEKGWYTPTIKDSEEAYRNLFKPPQVEASPSTSTSEAVPATPIGSLEQEKPPTLSDIAERLRSAPRYVQKGEISLRSVDAEKDPDAERSHNDGEIFPASGGVEVNDPDGGIRYISREEAENIQQNDTLSAEKEVSKFARQFRAMKNPFGDMMIERPAGVPNEFCPADAEIIVEIDPNNPNGFNPDSIQIISAGTIASSYEPIDRENLENDQDSNQESEPSPQNAPEQSAQTDENLSNSV